MSHWPQGEKKNIPGLCQVCHWINLKVFVQLHVILPAVKIPLIFALQGFCSNNMRASMHALLSTGY